MAVRLVEQDRWRAGAVPRCWWRGKNALGVPAVRVPEPAQLYSLVVLYLVAHAPHLGSGCCESCALPWPCAPVRLAYRLREGS
jgi:hypothetical protein